MSTTLDYTQQMRALEEVVRCAAVMLHGVDLEMLQQTLDRADSVGAILDPTAYRAALQDGRLEQQRELLAAVRPLRKYIAKRMAAEGMTP